MGMEKNAKTGFTLGGFKMSYIITIIKRLFNFSGKILYFNLLGMGLISLLEGAAIFLLIPLINLSGMINISTSTPQISYIFSLISGLPPTIKLPSILCFYVLLVIGQNILQRKLTIRNVILIQGFVHKLRLDTYRDLLQTDWGFFIKRRKSDLINLFTTEINRVIAGINLFLQLISSLVFTIIQVGLAFWLSPTMTIFVLVCGFSLSFFARTFIKKSKKLGNKTSEITKEYLGGMTDQLNGIKDIKSNTLEISRLNWLHSITKQMLVEQIEYIELKTSSQLFYKAGSAVFIALFIFLSVELFHAHTEQLMLIILIFSRLWPKVTGIQSNIEQLSSNIPAFKAFIELQQSCGAHLEINDPSSYENVASLSVLTELECRNVFFRYQPSQFNYALHNISCHIPANQMTAIVGRSGAGKSTFIDTLMGLLQPESGQVLIDGIPLSKNNLLSFRKAISYVPQDPFLFHGSIKENLLMIDSAASEKKIWTALEFAQCIEFISHLPEGLNTILGDRGIRLSGGERQRLVLARALLKKPSILILDEATSALDTENESKIQEALDSLKGKMTIIVIAHRLSTIRNADNVLVFEDGQIIQEGGFGQLANEKRGIFSHLLSQQIEKVD